MAETSECGKIEDKRKPDITNRMNREEDVIEILSDDDEVQMTGTLQSNENSGDRIQRDSNEDEIEITQVNEISRPHSVPIPIRRGSLQSPELSRSTRRRISREEEDEVQLVSERPLLQRPRNQQNIDHLLALQHQMEVAAANNDNDTRTHREDLVTGAMISNLVGEARRMSQGIGNRVSRNLRGSRRFTRRRPNRRYTPDRGNPNSNLEQFEIPMRLFGNIFSLNQPAFANDFEDNENAIMERIERSNEQAIGSRFASENVYNRKAKVEKKHIAKAENRGYTNDINGKATLGCELCGVELGQGIPDDFKPDYRYNEELESYAKEYRVNAPWFCIRQCSEVDKALSKRIFTSRCGHIYCGRCVKNIGNRPKRIKKKNVKLSIDDPGIFAPRSCPAMECGKNFTSKGFSELYF